MRALLLCCMAVLALAACASDTKIGPSSRQSDFQREFSGGTLCQSKDCTIDVIVGEGCAIRANPATLGVDTSIDDATIHWKISGGTATFTRDGINPKNNNWHSEFKSPNPGPTEFTWLDKNKQHGAPRKRPYGYNMEVKQGSTVCRVDPTIVNDY